MVSYETAFKRPFMDIKKLLIGIVLSIIPIVNFLAIGYQLKCAKSAMGKKFELPEWDDWANLFIKGLLMLIISLIYMIPTIVVFGIVMASVFPALISAVTSGEDVMSALFPSIAAVGVFGFVGVLVFLLTIYVVPSAVMHYVKDDNFGAAFRCRSIFKKAFTVKYFVVWLIAMVYSLILSLILLVIPFLGGAIASFITGVTGMTLYGEVFTELDEEKKK